MAESAAWHAACQGRLAMRLGALVAQATRVLAVMGEAIAYRRHEIVVAGLLAGSVVAGFAVEAWHRRAPALFARLEAEPPRLAAVSRSRPTPAAAPANLRRPDADRPRAPAARDGPRAVSQPVAISRDRPLDLDRATAEQLMALPGIGPRLAARIVARRQELGGRFPSFGAFATTPGLGLRRAGHVRRLVYVPAELADEPGPPARPGGVP